MPLLTLAVMLSNGFITADDYPPAAIRQHHQGLVSAEFVYDRSGRPIRCDIVASSGWPELDEQTCRLILQRARNSPVTDLKGEPIGAVQSLRFNWILPGSQGSAVPPVPPDEEFTLAALPKEMTKPSAELILVVSSDGKVENCSVKNGTGSVALDEAACLTLAKEVWPQIRDASKNPMRYLRVVKVAFGTEVVSKP